MRLGAVFAITLALLFPQVVQGQSDVGGITLPPGVPDLPAPIDAPVKGSIIGPENREFFKELLLPELYEGPSDSKIFIDAVAKLNYQLGFDDDWLTGTKELAGIKKSFKEDRSLEFSFPFKRGFLFGDGPALYREYRNLNGPKGFFGRKKKVQDVPKGLKADDIFGHKLLWNLNSLLWGNGLLDFHFRLLWLKDSRPYRSVRGNFKRVYPKVLDPKFAFPQIFRERILFYYPEALNGLAWLTFRFESNEEDAIWAYSPAIKKVRELTGSNRSDSLVTSSVAADDFLGWSGNVNAVRAKVITRTKLLVPFSSLSPIPLENAGGCLKAVGADFSGQSNSWNFENPKFKGGYDWLPAKGAFVPRDLYKIEISPIDPYYLNGREEVYLDAETMLPFYKIVYDRSGRHWKTVVIGWGFGKTKDGLRVVPIPGFQIVLDLVAKQTFVMDLTRFRACREYPSDLSLGDFDPKKLIPLTDLQSQAQ